MKFLTILAVLIGLGVAFIFYSEKSTIYSCRGTYQPSAEVKSLYLELVQYRLPIVLWSDGIWGYTFVELDDGLLQYFPSIRDFGGNLEISDGNGFVGTYRTRSSKLSIDTAGGFFEGDCHV